MSFRKLPRKVLSTAESSWLLSRRIVLRAGVLTLILFGGCYQRQEFKRVEASPGTMEKYCGDTPAALRSYCERGISEGRRNAVLNYMRMGVRAMELGYREQAEECFDSALNEIEAIYANTESSAKARSLYYEEGMKDFKGEPYERCMAYYYRGLLYLQKGDYDNARACFKGGILQDAFAEEEQHRCDFATLIFLEGWAAQLAGDIEIAKACYAETKRYRPDFNAPSEEANILIIAETGTSPRKLSDGVGHAELKFRRGRNFSEKSAEASINGNRQISLFPMEDVAWQAMSRGGRAVDKILQGKVEFRKTNEQVGTVLTDVSSSTMISAPLWGDNVETVQGISAAIGLVGVIQMAAGARARPHADTRYWDNIPDGIHVATIFGEPGTYKIRANFKDENGGTVPGVQVEKTFEAKKAGAALFWFRSRESVTSKL